LTKAIRLVTSVFALAFILSACSSTSSSPTTPSTSTASTQTGTSYSLFTDVTSVGALTNSTTSWVDISNIDGPPLASSGTGYYIVSDKINAGITVINNNTLTYVRTAGAFVGVGSTINGQREGGPNGNAVVGGSVVFAGDANSNLQVVNVNTGATLTPTAGCSNTLLTNGSNLTSSTPVCGIYTGGQYRLDEGAYDPVDGIVMMGNDEEQPPATVFETAFSPTACASTSATAANCILWQVHLPNANGGLEQPVYDATDKTFYVSVPSTVANAGGEIDAINPKTQALTTFSTLGGLMCTPNGLTLKPSTDVLYVGCSATNGTVVVSASTGAVLATVANSGGCDEVWYNATDNRFYCAGSSYTTPSLFVVDGSAYTLLATITTTTSAHSVAVDPTTNRVFVPVIKSSTGVTSGSGVAVFIHN
jgi:hypothetical protein